VKFPLHRGEFEVRSVEIERVFLSIVLRKVGLLTRCLNWERRKSATKDQPQFDCSR
jgi:hypothetical protein